MANGQCDFCSSPHVARLLPCRSFDSNSNDIGVSYHGAGVTLHSIDEWGACQPCIDLIEALDLDGLVRRALAAQERIFGDRVPAELVAHVRHTYGLFFKNRIGETKHG